MKLKGIELPVNSVIIIALAIMVLLMIAAFLMGADVSPSKVESAWSRGCGVLKSTYNCDASKVKDIIVTDITGDAVDDSLLVICRAKFKNDEASAHWCRNKCCTTVITEGTPCTDPEDCQIGWGRDNWACNPAVEPVGEKRCCSTSARKWNESAGTCQE